jgi:DMSO reductase family type II enzyme chaperone
MQTPEFTIEATTDQLRAKMYRLLAKAFQYPSKDIVQALSEKEKGNDVLEYTALTTRSPRFQNLIDDVRLNLQSVESMEVLEYEYNRLFAHLGSAKCPPYETEYGYDNVFQKTEAMADIAGFYYAYGLEVADQNTERVDFIGTELEFMSFLALNEAYARETGNTEQLEICLDTQRKFLQDHLGRWTTTFAKILVNSTTNGFYGSAGRLMAQFIQEEAARLHVVLNEVTGPNKEVLKTPDPFGCSGCSVDKSEERLSQEQRRFGKVP